MSVRHVAPSLVSSLALAACDPDASQPDPPSPPDAGAEACITWTGDRQLGTDRDDRAGVAISRRGEVIVFGYESGLLGVENLEPAGTPRGFVERLAGPTPGWRWELAPARGATIDAIDVRADAVAVAGRVREAPTTERRAQYDAFVGQLDLDGTLVAQHTLGEAASEHPRQLASAGSWNVQAGYVDVYIPTNHVVDVEDPYVVTWQDGQLAAARMFRFDTAWTDLVDGAVIDERGLVTIAGSSRGGPVAGAFARRIDAGGSTDETIWLSRGPLESLAAIRRAPDGDLVVAGSTWLPLDGRPGAGGEDVFVARYDATFTERRWLRTLGTAASELALDLHVADDGRVWLLGETLGSFDRLPNRGQTDLFVAALDAGGEVRWIEQRGSAGDERATSLAVDACEQVLVAGATDGALVPGATPSGYDAFVIRVTR